MRKFFLIVLLGVSSLISEAQNSLDFRQFYFNPFLFNPAYAGSGEYSEFAITHRQQWVDFKDSPVASGFTFQDPSQRRISLGFNFLTEKSIALRNSSVQVAFAYPVYLTQTQKLIFALSGGMGVNGFDLEGRDYSNDPLILKASQNRVYPEGSFGALYVAGDFSLGIALPTLFNQQGTGSGGLKTHPMQQLLNQLYSVKYKFVINDQFSVEPYVLYRLNRDLQNYWEVASLLYFKENIWIGSSYQVYNGLAFYFGFTIKDNFRVGYDYEVSSNRYSASNSHEVQMSFRFGEKKGYKPTEKSSHSGTLSH